MSGWGGGGGGARNGRPRIPPIWGPKGSGAILTPGENWPFHPDDVRNLGILALLVLVLLSSSRK